MASPEVPSCQPLPELPTGGYDDDYFINTPPESLHCPVCLLVLREPHLISCCGKHLCQVCIESIQANEQSCPCCRSEKYMHMLNKEKRGKVLELKVRCINNMKGCDWVGELGDQERHCNNKCEYVEAMCQYGCGRSYPRFRLVKHEQDECSDRPIDLKMATFTRQMMEKVIDMETKYEGEIDILKQKIKGQEEQHKKELLENFEAGKREMRQQLNVQAEGMKKKTEADKEQILQLMKEEQERHNAEIKELANKLEKQREEYELNMKKTKKEDKEDLQHQIEMLQKMTEKDKMDVLLQLTAHNNCDNDTKKKLTELWRTAETLQNQVQQYENERKTAEKKLKCEYQTLQQQMQNIQQSVQQQMQTQRDVDLLKRKQAEDISQLKKDLEVSNKLRSDPESQRHSVHGQQNKEWEEVMEKFRSDKNRPPEQLCKPQ